MTEHRQRFEELRRKRDREGLSQREAEEYSRLVARFEKREPPDSDAEREMPFFPLPPD